MGLHAPDDYTMTPGSCHICHGEIRQDQYGIDHMGSLDEDSYVTLWFHPACATVMALRLAHDVMRVKSAKDQPARVVDALQAMSKINQAR